MVDSLWHRQSRLLLLLDVERSIGSFVVLFGNDHDIARVSNQLPELVFRALHKHHLRSLFDDLDSGGAADAREDFCRGRAPPETNDEAFHEVTLPTRSPQT